jgi:hypothetical protein
LHRRRVALGRALARAPRRHGARSDRALRTSPARAVAGAEHARGLRRRRLTRGGGALARGDAVGAVAQRSAHLARGLIALARVQRKRDGDRLGELRPDRRDQRVEHRRRLLLLLERQLGQRAGLIRQATGDQLIGDHAQRIEVGARARLFAASLLGREVGGRAEHRPDLRDARLLGRLGDAEVRELDLAFARAQQVARLDVAVHHAVTMRVVQALARLVDDRDRLVDLQPTVVAQDLRARLALDVLHHDVVLARALILSGVEHLHDVRVHQAGGGLRLALKA